MSDLLELAERCEKASRRNDELTALIRAACFGPPGAIVKQSRINGAWCAYVEQGGKERSVEYRNLTYEQQNGDFTASLDASMALVPEGWSFGAGNDSVVPGPAGWAWVSSEEDFRLHRAATPALALCAAALRARASQ